MKISSVARTATAIVVAMAALGAASTSYAQNSIFPTGWDNKVRDRLFMRFGYTQTFTKTKSEDAKDVTGPVVTRADLAAAFALGEQISIDCDSGALTGTDCDKYADYFSPPGYVYGPSVSGVLTTNMENLGLTGLGTPAGVKAKAQKSVGTPTISIGYWLDDDYKWLVEAYVLAAPLSVKIYGDGVRADGTPNSVNGKHIATTKLLPPLVIGSYNFGSKRDVVRPFVGVGGMYAIFFDARTTPFFDEYMGGKTTLTTKNVFGFGPFLGLQSEINENWHVNLTVGQVALKAKSTLITSGTQIRSGALVLNDYPEEISKTVSDAEKDVWNGTRPDNPNALTTAVMDLVKRSKNNASDLGTFVREQKMRITNTIVTLSVGRSF